MSYTTKAYSQLHFPMCHFILAIKVKMIYKKFSQIKKDQSLRLISTKIIFFLKIMKMISQVNIY